MLVHRLPPDPAERSVVTVVPVFPAVDPVPRVDLRRARSVLLVVDLASIVVLGWALQTQGHGLPGGGSAIVTIAWAAVTAVVWLAVAHLAALYGKAPLMKGRSPVAPALAGALTAYAPVLAAAMIQAGIAGASMTVPVLCTLFAALFIGLSRIVWRVTLGAVLSRGACIDRVVVLAPSHPAARITAAAIDRMCQGRLRTVASLAMPAADCGAFLAWIEALVQRAEADQFIVVQQAGQSQACRNTTWQMVRAGADVTIIPAFGAPHRIARLSSMTPDMPALDGAPAPLNELQSRMKRGFDVVVASLLLVLTSPIWLLVAVAIRLDGVGPVFFRQDRHGHQGQVFQIWKFRTMRPARNEPDCTMQTSRNDSRVTRIGAFLRRTSLDELPQLLNVLAGDMSVVGPRPHAVGMLVAGEMPFSILQDYDVRHDVKPGITGWAQVNGSRGELATARSLRRRFALDRYYIENWSIRLDAAILLRTVALPFTDRFAF